MKVEAVMAMDGVAMAMRRGLREKREEAELIYKISV
jgi:hypothetical protein